MQAGTSVDEFLISLGLEKYLITFQAEEVWKLFASCCVYENCVLPMLIPNFLLLHSGCLNFDFSFCRLI